LFRFAPSSASAAVKVFLKKGSELFKKQGFSFFISNISVPIPWIIALSPLTVYL
jgi:hypothetical protein